MMNKKVSRHPELTIIELQCPICGETYYITDTEQEENGDIYECELCDYEAPLEDWPWQEYTRGRLSVATDAVILEEMDW